jgi:hypothetical protein
MDDCGIALASTLVSTQALAGPGTTVSRRHATSYEALKSAKRRPASPKKQPESVGILLGSAKTNPESVRRHHVAQRRSLLKAKGSIRRENWSDA